MADSQFTVEIGARTYDITFTPPVLRESERALETPLWGIIRDGRGLTLEQTERLLWVQIRRQNKRLTPQKFQELLDAHWASGHAYLEAALMLIQAFNASGLAYRVDRGEDEEGATADAASTRPTLAVVPTALSTSPSQEPSTSG